MSTKYKTAKSNQGQETAYESGFENSEVVETSPPTLINAAMCNSGASVLYLMIFDSATVPGNGTAPSTMPIAVPAGSTVSFSYNDVASSGFYGLGLKAGLSWAASTTAATLTVATGNASWVQLRYTI
jgi:hypothetical protein